MPVKSGSEAIFSLFICVFQSVALKCLPWNESKQKMYSSASFFPPIPPFSSSSSPSSFLEFSSLSILINLKGPFPLLQEQQLIKWLISDGRVWMFWVNFIDLWEKLTSPPAHVDLHLRHLKTPLNPDGHWPTLSCTALAETLWLSLPHTYSHKHSKNSSEKDILFTYLHEYTSLLQGL